MKLLTPPNLRAVAFAMIALAACYTPGSAAPPGTPITYQGHLVYQGQPANGQFDFEFSLHFSDTQTQAIPPVLTQTLQVTNGLFTTVLDFEDAWNIKEPRWLEIDVKAVGAPGARQALLPRQEIRTVPYAQSSLDLRLPWFASTNADDPLSAIDLTNHGNGSALKLFSNAPSPNAGLRVENNGSGAGVQVKARCDNGEAAVKIFNVFTPGSPGTALFTLNSEGVDRAPDISPEQFAGGMSSSYAAASSAVIGDRPVKGSRTTGSSGPAIGSIFVGDIGGWGFGIDSVGVIGQCPNGSGVFGTTDSLSGATNTNPDAIGVEGFSAYGTGMSAETQFGTAVKGKAVSGSAYAGWFEGRVQVVGNFAVTGVKAFLIDHPLDPENKLLAHASIESAEALNLYRGNVTLNDDGEATVTLPVWFEALNRDFTYQITPIGAPAPNLFIAEKIHDLRFRIGGGPAGIEVSWIVTGVRQDRYMREHPLQVEQLKTDRLLGSASPATRGGKP